MSFLATVFGHRITEWKAGCKNSFIYVL